MKDMMKIVDKSTLSEEEQKKLEQPKVEIVEEKVNGKIILRVKDAPRNERKPSTVLGIVYGKSNYKNLLK